MKVRGEYWLRPSNRLRINWGFMDNPGKKVQLEKLKVFDETGGPMTIFCGLEDFNTPAHQDPKISSPKQHAMMIIPGSHKDILEVKFFENPNDDDCETVWNNQQSIVDHHGGVAHIEN